MTAADWIAGMLATAILWAALVRRVRIAQTRRDRRELRRAAERAYRGPHEA